MKREAQTVGFRLEDPYLEQLEKAAAEYDLSPGQFARRLVIEALTAQRFDLLAFQVNELHEGVTKGIEQILTQVIGARGEAGRTAEEQAEHVRDTKAEVSEWVKVEVRRQD